MLSIHGRQRRQGGRTRHIEERLERQLLTGRERSEEIGNQRFVAVRVNDHVTHQANHPGKDSDIIGGHIVEGIYHQPLTRPRFFKAPMHRNPPLTGRGSRDAEGQIDPSVPRIPSLGLNDINIFPQKAIHRIVEDAARPRNHPLVGEGHKVSEGEATDAAVVLVKEHTIEEGEQRFALLKQPTGIQFLNAGCIDIDAKIRANTHGMCCL